MASKSYTPEDATRQTLYEIMSADELSLCEKQTEVLKIGCEYLNVQNGHIERANELSSTHEVVVSVGGPADLLPEGATLDRATTYCRRTMDANSPLALSNAPKEGWAEDPAYEEHGFDCYLGAPIFVRGEPYGTVCFVDDAARESSFGTNEKAFVELVARLFGRELEATSYKTDLTDAHRRRESLLTAAPDAIFLADASTGDIVDVNEEAATLSGYDADELKKMAISDLQPSNNHEQYEGLLERLAATGDTTRSLSRGDQLELQTADRGRVPIEISAGTVELAGSCYIQGVVREITDRVQREQELERERELFAHSQKLANIGGWEYDCDTDELYWTDEVRRIYDVDEEFTPSLEDGISFFHSDDRPRLKAAIERAIEDGEPYDIELRIITGNEETRWVHSQAKPVQEDGQIVRLRGTFQDITERKEREEELRLRTRAMEEAGVGISISDATEPETPLLYVNDAFTELTGYDREAVLGRNCRFLQGSKTDSASVDIVRSAIEQEETRTAELLNYRANGTPFWNELTVTPVTGPTGEVSHFVGIQRDVTGRKRRERLIGVLNRILRHNLRNDMNVVGGLGETIASNVDGEVSAYAETIAETAWDLVALSKKAKTVEEAFRNDSESQPLNIVEVIEDLVADLRKKYPETTIRCELPDEQEAMTTEKLPKALTELVENAVSAGASTVTLAIVLAEDRDQVNVEVRDDGPGLPEAEIRVLQQASESPLEHGSGFGLWMVNWLVTEMGGEVDVAAKDGTAVTISLQTSRRNSAPGGGFVGDVALGADPNSRDW